MSVTLHIWVSIHHLIMFFVAQVQNDDISRYFFHFFKSLVFWVVKGGGGGKGQKMAQSEKKNSHSVSQELYLIWLRFLLLMCKLISPATFFHFSKFWFLGFSKFINKCQKEIPRCAPPSSHVCDFFNRTKTFFTYKVFFSKKYKKVLFQRISLENIKDATTMSRQQIKIYMQRIKMSRWSTKIDCDFFDKA